MRQAHSAKDRKTDGSVRKDISSLFIFEDVIWAKYGIQEMIQAAAVTREHYFWRAEMPTSETNF